MEDSSVLPAQNEPLIPQHTRQATKAILMLLFFSFLMFSLPFGAYYLTKSVLIDYLHMVGFQVDVWGVIAAVATVNLIIMCYAYIAYHEQEYDDAGNPVVEKSGESIASAKSDLNLKQD